MKIIKLLLLFILLTSCENTQIKLKKDTLIYEYGEEVSLQIKDLITCNKEKEIKNMKLDLSINNSVPAVGKYKGNIIYDKKHYPFLIEVKDTTAPKFINFKDTIETYIDSTKQPSSFFEVNDLSEYSLSFSNKINLKKAGKYKSEVIASDLYGNKTTKEVLFIVKDLPPIKKEETTIQETTPQIQQKEEEIEVCEANGQWNMVGNSNFASYSYEEAFDYAQNHTPENYGAVVLSTHDLCGKEGWSVHWYELED